MKTTLKSSFVQSISRNLQSAHKKSLLIAMQSERQPIHSVYGGAHLFKSDTAKKLGEIALRSFLLNAPDVQTFAKTFDLGLDSKLTQKVYDRVKVKLATEALEDFRIDFEDGFGIRSDIEEDEFAVKSAAELALGLQNKTLPPFIGIRIKSFSEDHKERAIRTLDLFLSQLLRDSKGSLPKNFVITLPKITFVQQVSALVKILEAFETLKKLKRSSLKIELMIETPQVIFDREGRLTLPALIKAGKGRVRAVHFGVYDYAALNDIAPRSQKIDSDASNFAREIMRISLAQSGIWISDGATPLIPVGATEAVHHAWKVHYQNIRHALEQGFYQGWDLHPAQFIARYAAYYAFFLESSEEATLRLKNFIDQATKASLIGSVFDDAATAQGLLHYFVRAYQSGAIDEAELAHTGLSLQELQSRSFGAILKSRLKVV